MGNERNRFVKSGCLSSSFQEGLLWLQIFQKIFMTQRKKDALSNMYIYETERRKHLMQHWFVTTDNINWIIPIHN